MHLNKIMLAILLLGLTQSRLNAQDQTEGNVEVTAEIALGVEDRQPVSPGTEFPADVGQLYAWTKVTGAANTTIQHIWRHQDHEFAVPLNIGGSPWRVWSTKNIPPEWTGEWTFQVKDSDGNVVFETNFTVGSR
ncbi:MAG: DUF2914 domain-containing protein [Gemmatimonadales bacterium]